MFLQEDLLFLRATKYSVDQSRFPNIGDLGEATATYTKILKGVAAHRNGNTARCPGQLPHRGQLLIDTTTHDSHCDHAAVMGSWFPSPSTKVDTQSGCPNHSTLVTPVLSSHLSH